MEQTQTTEQMFGQTLEQTPVQMAPPSVGQDTEIGLLEEKIEQVVALVTQLRAENADLRQRLTVVENEREQLRTSMNSARERLEGLLVKLPEGV